MTLTIAAIRARHAARPAPPPPAADLPPEAAEWVAAVGRLSITRHLRTDGYELAVGRARVARVEARDEGFVVVNLRAGHRSPPIARHLADAMAMRIARLHTGP